MKQQNLTVTVTHVGHPYPNFLGGATPQITVGICAQGHQFTFPSSPLSMLIQKGDTITISPTGGLNKVNGLTSDMLSNVTEFDGIIDRISHPLWLPNPKSGFNCLYIIITAQELMFPVRVNWNTLLLRRGDDISIKLKNFEILKFKNKTLKYKFNATSKQSAQIKGRIKRVTHPMMWTNAQGIMGLNTLAIMEDFSFKIIPATPESMFLEDGDTVEISDTYIKNQRIPEVRFCGDALPEYYEVKYVGHPFPALVHNGKKLLGRYLITTENELYLVPANETNMLTQVGDKIFNF